VIFHPYLQVEALHNWKIPPPPQAENMSAASIGAGGGYEKGENKKYENLKEKV
jgi:hypothetical protein